MSEPWWFLIVNSSSSSAESTTTSSANSNSNANGKANATPDCSLDELERLLHQYELARSIDVIYYLVLFVFAAVLNVRVLVVIATSSKDDVRSRMLYPQIALLSVFDVVSVSAAVLKNFGHLFSIPPDTMSRYLSNGLFCKVPMFIYIGSQFVSSWTVLIVSIERFIVIKYPLLSMRFRSRRVVLIGMSVLTTIGFAFAAPKLLTTSVVTLSAGVMTCESTNDDDSLFDFDVVYTTIVLSISTLVPAAGILIISICMIVEMKRATKRAILMHSACFRDPIAITSSYRQAAKSRYLRLTTMVIVLAIVYTVLQVPDVGIWMISHFSGDQFSQICRYLQVTNVYIYLLMIGDLVTITNPIIFLICKSLADRPKQKLASRHSQIHFTSSSSITETNVPKRASTATVFSES